MVVNAATTVVKTAKLKFRNFMNQYATSIKDQENKLVELGRFPFKIYIENF